MSRSRAVWGGKDVFLSSFIGSDEVFGVSEMGKWFPGVFRRGIAFPTDVELLADSGASMGDDGFHGVFFFSLDDGGRRR